MTDVRAEALRQLVAVRTDFEGRLPGLIEEIAKAWAAVQRERDRAPQLSRMIALAHGVAGNAGVFGLHEVAQAASALEQALEDTSYDGMAFRESHASEIGQSIDRLRALVQSRATSRLAAPTASLRQEPDNDL